MVSKNIWNAFTNVASFMVPEVKAWFSNEKNSIRVQRSSGPELIFTYNREDDWELKTKNFKGGKK